MNSFETENDRNKFGEAFKCFRNCTSFEYNTSSDRFFDLKAFSIQKLYKFVTYVCSSIDFYRNNISLNLWSKFYPPILVSYFLNIKPPSLIYISIIYNLNCLRNFQISIQYIYFFVSVSISCLVMIAFQNFIIDVSRTFFFLYFFRFIQNYLELVFVFNIWCVLFRKKN